MYEEIHGSVIVEEAREDGSRTRGARHKENEGGKRSADEEQSAGQARSQANEEGRNCMKLIIKSICFYCLTRKINCNDY